MDGQEWEGALSVQFTTVSNTIDNEFGPPLLPYLQQQQQQQQVPPQWYKQTFTRRLAKRCLLVLISLMAFFLATEFYHLDKTHFPTLWRSPFISSESSPSSPAPDTLSTRVNDDSADKTTTSRPHPGWPPTQDSTTPPESLPPSGQRRPRARIINVIPVNDELDQLEIRMNELDTVVDMFVTVESNYTYMDKRKPLYFYENKDRFKQFAHQTMNLYVPPMELGDRNRVLQEQLYDVNWAPEVVGRSMGLRLALNASQARTGDWIVYSDLDEIPRKEVITALHGVDSENMEDRVYRSGQGQGEAIKVLPQGKDIFRLDCAFYEFSYEYQFEKLPWTGPVIFRYFKQNSTVYDDFVALSASQQQQLQDQQQPAKATSSRTEVFEHFKGKELSYYDQWVQSANRTSEELRIYRDAMKNLWVDGGFKANISQILYKLRSSSHREYNRKEVANKARILDRARTGQDLMGRPNHTLVYVPNNMDVPTSSTRTENSISIS
ncbi:hypothetical protein BGX29_001212 [Mortierella sp. GBA35]|nr:hypothetical protein BGX29_001212 [Mortierella sp. GBA35]